MVERKESKEETVLIERIEASGKDVAQRAYELYAQRGGEPGRDVEDWVRAEKELNSGVAVGSAKTKGAQAGRN
jgi:hypothetical protein